MTTPDDIVKAVGRKNIREALGLGKSAVSMAVARGRFPPAWFDGIDALCREKGQDCPRSAFAFREHDADERSIQDETVE